MRIIEIHRGHIKIDVSGRTATIGGEGFGRPIGHIALPTGYVDYVVYANTLTHWDSPWAHELLPADLQRNIIAFLQEDFARRGLLLAVE